MPGLKSLLFVVVVVNTCILSTCSSQADDAASSLYDLTQEAARTSSERKVLPQSNDDISQATVVAQSQEVQITASVARTQSAAGQQEKRHRQTQATYESHIIDFAPAVNVTFGGDVDFEGQCKVEIDKYCDDIEEGEGKLAECLSDFVSLSENPEQGDKQEEIPVISDACREEVYQFKISRNSNINKNVPLATACKLNAAKMCNVTWFFGYRPGQVIACLRENKDKLDKECQSEVFKVQMDVAEDIRADPGLWEDCKTDADTLCKDVKSGGGRVQSCLRENRMKLNWKCDDMLFRQEVENADDIRLSVQLNAKCMADWRKFCQGVEPGNARVLGCLEEHRLQLGLACRQEIDNMLERRASDFRLDFKLRTACNDDIADMCAYNDELGNVGTYNPAIVYCLQDYNNGIKSLECKAQVKKYTVLAAQDIRFSPRIKEACYVEKQALCSHSPSTDARRCLSQQMDKLSTSCRVALFEDKVRFSESIDFQLPMKEACQAELGKFCKDVPHGNALSMRCLQDHKNDGEFGTACKEGVVAYEKETAQDYRLNHPLAKNCKEEIETICPNMCSSNNEEDVACGGKVLRCLTDNMDNIKADGCRQEMVYYKNMQVVEKSSQNDGLLHQDDDANAVLQLRNLPVAGCEKDQPSVTTSS